MQIATKTPSYENRPPLCCSRADIDLLIARFGKTLNDTLNVKEMRDALD
jgi:hypothetical protein